jgi:hypothetical protein
MLWRAKEPAALGRELGPNGGHRGLKIKNSLCVLCALERAQRVGERRVFLLVSHSRRRSAMAS